MIRAGYGINYNTTQPITFAQQLAFQPPFSVTQTNVSGEQGCGVLQLANAFNCSTAATQNNYSVNLDYRLGRVQILEHRYSAHIADGYRPQCRIQRRRRRQSGHDPDTDSELRLSEHSRSTTRPRLGPRASTLSPSMLVSACRRGSLCRRPTSLGTPSTMPRLSAALRSFRCRTIRTSMPSTATALSISVTSSRATGSLSCPSDPIAPSSRRVTCGRRFSTASRSLATLPSQAVTTSHRVCSRTAGRGSDGHEQFSARRPHLLSAHPGIRNYPGLVQCGSLHHPFNRRVRDCLSQLYRGSGNGCG